MSLQVQIRSDPRFLEVSATGDFSLEDAQRTFVEMLDAVVRTGATRILFDGGALQGDPTIMERFYYGEFAAQAVAERGLSGATKFAYVLQPPVLDRGRFGENVAVNRGMAVKAFDDRADAVRWLGVKAADQPS